MGQNWEDLLRWPAALPAPAPVARRAKEARLVREERRGRDLEACRRGTRMTRTTSDSDDSDLGVCRARRESGKRARWGGLGGITQMTPNRSGLAAQSRKRIASDSDTSSLSLSLSLSSLPLSWDRRDGHLSQQGESERDGEREREGEESPLSGDPLSALTRRQVRFRRGTKWGTGRGAGGGGRRGTGKWKGEGERGVESVWGGLGGWRGW